MTDSEIIRRGLAALMTAPASTDEERTRAAELLAAFAHAGVGPAGRLFIERGNGFRLTFDGGPYPFKGEV